MFDLLSQQDVLAAVGFVLTFALGFIGGLLS
jgi:hypothetical protein